MTTTKTTHYYQLLAGLHWDAKDGRKYVPGDIVKSERNLETQFGSSKFRRLSDKEVEALQDTDDEVLDVEPRRKKKRKKKKRHIEV